MVGALLARGMLVGLAAALLSFGFLKIAGEPAVEQAIAFEHRMDDAKQQAKVDDAIARGLPAPVEEHEQELVSRQVQAGIGLLTGIMLYSVAFGGLFALAFALAYGRMGSYGPRTTSALLAMSGFIAVYLVPNLKYPANPPSVGDPDTIDMRTGVYFAMMAISIAAMIAAWMLRKRLMRSRGAWNAAISASGVYAIAAVLASIALPIVNEVPDGFPATVLWQFRMAALGAQAIMWATIGLGFGALAERGAMANHHASAGTI